MCFTLWEAGDQVSPQRQRGYAATSESLLHRLVFDLELVDRLIAAGLPVMEEGATNEPEALTRAADNLRGHLIELAATDPLAAERMGLRPLDVLCCDERPASDYGRPLAVAFSDLEGFTRFTYEHGDFAARQLLDEHYAAMQDVVDRHAGRVVKRIGDGHMLSFDAPEAAVRAAIESVSAAPAPLPARVGVAYGAVVQTEDDIFGHVVNLAARVTDTASGGTALVTADVHTAVGDQSWLVYDAPVETQVRGIEGTVTTYGVHAA